MPKKSVINGDDLISQLKTFNISEEFYEKNHRILRAEGYSELESQTLILRKESEKIVKILLSFNNKLINKGFTHNQLVRITGRRKGFNNLEAVFKYKSRLTKLNFSQEEITDIAAHDGGSRNLEAVLKHRMDLIQLGFSQEEIISIVRYNSGSLNLEAVLMHFNALHQHGLSKEQIIHYAARYKGADKLNAINNLYPRFTNSFDNDIIDLLTSPGWLVDEETNALNDDLSLDEETFDLLTSPDWFTQEDLSPISTSVSSSSLSLFEVSNNKRKIDAANFMLFWEQLPLPDTNQYSALKTRDLSSTMTSISSSSLSLFETSNNKSKLAEENKELCYKFTAP